MRCYYGLNNVGNTFFYIPKLLILHLKKEKVFDRVTDTNFKVRIGGSLIEKIDKAVSTGRISAEVLENRGWVVREGEIDDRLIQLFENYHEKNPESSEAQESLLGILGSTMSYMGKIVATYSNVDETGMGYYPETILDWMQGGDDAN